VPVRRQVRKLRAVGDQLGHSVKREMSEVEERGSGMCFLDRRTLPQDAQKDQTSHPPNPGAKTRRSAGKAAAREEARRTLFCT